MPEDAPSPQRIDVAAVRRAHPVAEVVARYRVALRPVGRALVGRCPLHDDRTHPNLHVYPESDLAGGNWFCYRCDVGGDVIELVQRLERLSFLDAVAHLEGGRSTTASRRADNSAGVPPVVARAAGAFTAARPADETGGLIPSAAAPERPAPLDPAARACLDTAIALYHRRLLADGRALAYVERRGIDRETIRRFRVGYAAGELTAALRRANLPTDAAVRAGLLTADGREFLRGRVVVPELRDGAPLWAVGRALDADAAGLKYLGLPGRKPLLGLGAAAGAPEVCLVEGPFDALALAAWGVPAVALVGTHVRGDVLAELAGFERVYLVLDADGPGHKATAVLRRALGPRAVALSLAGIRGVKDPADLVLLPDGRERLERRLRAAAGWAAGRAR